MKKKKKYKKRDIPLKEWDLVRLDVDRIRGHPDFENLVWEYKQFVRDFQGKTFKISDEGRRFAVKDLFMLADDERTYKWLIHESNLIKVKKEKAVNG